MTRSTSATVGMLVLFALAVWLAQMQLNPFYLQILGLLGINIIATVSLNFAAGFGGMFSLGHPAFMAIGTWAYHSTCERQRRPTIRIANSLRRSGSDVFSSAASQRLACCRRSRM